MGSGKLISAAIKKHGLENFTKEVLFSFEDETSMNLKEAEIVTRDFCLRPDTYNLCPGGNGGWGYLNDGSDDHKKRCSAGARETNSKLKTDDELKLKWKKSLSRGHARSYESGKRPRVFVGKSCVWVGRKHKEDSKRKMSLSGSGSSNSQYGTKWVTDGFKSVKVKHSAVDTYLNSGYTLGRAINK